MSEIREEAPESDEIPARHTVLIVDDEPANLTALSNLLTPAYRVVAAKAGEVALEIVARGEVDLILLDVVMPKVDGYEVLRRLRATDRGADTPVIFVTSLDGVGDEELGLSLGAVDYITKPVRPAIVRARVRAHLDLKVARDRLRRQNQWLESEVARRTWENTLIQDAAITALAQICETRDAETGYHVQRTQAYIEALARQLQSHPRFEAELDIATLARIIKASPLHDIGKVGIPDEILLKPGKLTAEEWEVMKSHAAIGADVIRNAIRHTIQAHPNVDEPRDDGMKREVREILKSLSEKISGGHTSTATRNDASRDAPAKPEALALLEVAELIARHHHEKWDGSGYPDGLSGETIPTAARLMALADVFDAVTTPRPYKEAWSMDEASALIRAERGKHFDPDIVDAFEAVIADFDYIRRHLADAEMAAE